MTADKIEAAEQGGRELDAEIAVTVLGMSRDGSVFYGSDEDFVLERDYYSIEGSARELPHYTTSIDAAMTLVPDNCGFVLHSPVGKRPSVALHFGDEDFPAPKTVDGWGDYSSGATPALAVCAAALKARAAL